MIVSVSGTREGASDAQLLALAETLLHYKETHGSNVELHHGDCLGVDVQAAEVAAIMKYEVVSHPPTKNNMRAFHDSDVIMPTKGYLERDRDLAELCDVLIAMPLVHDVNAESGTWYTIRHAMRINKDVIVIDRDGILHHY